MRFLYVYSGGLNIEISLACEFYMLHIFRKSHLGGSLLERFYYFCYYIVIRQATS